MNNNLSGLALIEKSLIEKAVARYELKLQIAKDAYEEAKNECYLQNTFTVRHGFLWLKKRESTRTETLYYGVGIDYSCWTLPQKLVKQGYLEKTYRDFVESTKYFTPWSVEKDSIIRLAFNSDKVYLNEDLCRFVNKMLATEALFPIED